MWGSSDRANVTYFGVASKMLDILINPGSKRKQEAACQCESVYCMCGRTIGDAGHVDQIR